VLDVFRWSSLPSRVGPPTAQASSQGTCCLRLTVSGHCLCQPVQCQPALCQPVLCQPVLCQLSPRLCIQDCIHSTEYVIMSILYQHILYTKDTSDVCAWCADKELAGMDAQEAAKMLRGQAGTPVVLKLQHTVRSTADTCRSVPPGPCGQRVLVRPDQQVGGRERPIPVLCGGYRGAWAMLVSASVVLLGHGRGPASLRAWRGGATTPRTHSPTWPMPPCIHRTRLGWASPPTTNLLISTHQYSLTTRARWRTVLSRLPSLLVQY